MVKVNFREAPAIPGTSRESTEEFREILPKEESTAEKTDEMDFSFDSTESFFPKADVTEPAGEEPSEPFPEKKEIPPQPEPARRSFDFASEDTGQPSVFSGNKLYYIFGAAAVILIIAIIFIFRSMDHKSGPSTAETSQPAAGTEAAKEPSGSEAAMLPIYRTNLGTNRFIESRLTNFIARKPNSANYSLIVMTPDEILLTVLAGSRDQIAQFNIDLKKTFPSLPFRIVSVQSKFENNKEMFYADIRAETDKSDIQPASAVSVPVQPRDISNDLKELAQQHRVKLQYLKEGNVSGRNLYREINYYINLSGKKDNIMSFLSDMVKSYPMIRINKFSIYPYNLETISSQNLLTRLNFTYYKLK